jgi:hypothetical protein
MRTILLLSILVATPAYYWPKVTHLDQDACRRFLKTGSREWCREKYGDAGMRAVNNCREQLAESDSSYCEWHGGLDLSAECIAGYHPEQRTWRADVEPDLVTNVVICVHDGMDGGSR